MISAARFLQHKHADDAGALPEAPKPYLGGFAPLVDNPDPAHQHHLGRLVRQYHKEETEKETGKQWGQLAGGAAGLGVGALGTMAGGAAGDALGVHLSLPAQLADHQQLVDWAARAKAEVPEGVSLEHFPSPGPTPTRYVDDYLGRNKDWLGRQLSAARERVGHNFDSPSDEAHRQWLSKMHDELIGLLPHPESRAARLAPWILGGTGLALGAYGGYRAYKALRDWGARRGLERARSDDPSLNNATDMIREQAKSAALTVFAGVENPAQPVTPEQRSWLSRWWHGTYSPEALARSGPASDVGQFLYEQGTGNASLGHSLDSFLAAQGGSDD